MRYSIFILLILVVSLSVYAQTPAWLCAENAGGSDSDKIRLDNQLL